MKKSFKKTVSIILGLSFAFSSLSTIYASTLPTELLSYEGAIYIMEENDRLAYVNYTKTQAKGSLTSLNISFNYGEIVQIKGYSVNDEVYVPLQSIANPLDYTLQIYNETDGGWSQTQAFAARPCSQRRLKISTTHYLEQYPYILEQFPRLNSEIPTLNENSISVNLEKFYLESNSSSFMVDTFNYNGNYFVKLNDMIKAFNSNYTIQYNNAVRFHNGQKGTLDVKELDNITMIESENLVNLNKTITDLTTFTVIYEPTNVPNIDVAPTETIQAPTPNETPTTSVETPVVIPTVNIIPTINITQTPTTENTSAETTTSTNTATSTTTSSSTSTNNSTDIVPIGAFTSAPTVGKIYANILIDKNEPIYIDKGYRYSVSTDPISSTYSNSNMDNFTTAYQQSKGYSDVLCPLGQCTWYARGRFAEVTGIKVPNPRKQFLDPNSPNVIQSSFSHEVDIIIDITKIQYPSIATWESHLIFIEFIEYDTNGKPTFIYFSEANANNEQLGNPYRPEVDGKINKSTYDEFVNNNYNNISSNFLGYIIPKA